MSFLDGDMAAAIGDAFQDIFFPAVLSRMTVTDTSPPSDPWNQPRPDAVDHACVALDTRWEASFLARGLVQASDVKVLVLATSIDVDPIPGDRISVTRSGGGGLFTVMPERDGQPAVSIDPAHAVWVLRCSR